MEARAPRLEDLPVQLLRRRLEAFAVGSSLAIFPTFAAIFALIGIYGKFAPASLIAPWAVIAGALVAARIVVGLRVHPLGETMAELAGKWRAVNAVLILGSLAWAISLPAIAWLSTGLPVRSPATLAVIGAALLGGVLLMHRSAPVAGAFHIIALAGGLGLAEYVAGGSASWPLLCLIAVFAATLLGALRVQDQQFRRNVEADLARRNSEGTVRMLLNEHEAQGADWLWTTRPDGSLRDVSSRFGEVLGTAPSALDGLMFAALFDPGEARDRLAARMADGGGFRDLAVPIVVSGERRVWRITGHPRSDGGMAGVGRDVTDQQRIEERVRAMAYADPLTGLANRHAFNQCMREIFAAEPGSRPRRATLLFVDLDDFKSFNELHGPEFSDHVLRELGARLRSQTGADDLLARYSGDKFAILVEAPAGDGMLLEKAHRLLAAIRDPLEIEGQTARVSASIGIARSRAAGEAPDLLRRANLALRAAQSKGRDQLALFDEAMERRARERRSLELDLREALARGELALHYQPIIALNDGETVGYEALLRWHHPAHGMLLPDRFLPIAEETGLMVPLGDWVIRQALGDVAEWPGDFRLAINLSPSQVRNPLLIATVDNALAVAGFPARRLEFEITEQILLKDTAAGAAMLDRLRALGAEIALDDFGTGYSSLSYLRRFRFDRIKIDRSFVRDIETSAEAQAIVSAITRLADALGMRTTAEGVEQPGQLDLLRKLGCHEAQGFLILRPVEAGRIAEARAKGSDLPDGGAEIAAYREGRRALQGLARIGG